MEKNQYVRIKSVFMPFFFFGDSLLQYSLIWLKKCFWRARCYMLSFSLAEMHSKLENLYFILFRIVASSPVITSTFIMYNISNGYHPVHGEIIVA